MAKQLKITLTRSPISRVPKHKKTVKALGLSRPNKSVIHNDCPQIRGMINSIGFMVEVEELNA